ncbi:hypothetical protein TI03_02100, partial [Achromatium sp. WMS1]
LMFVADRTYIMTSGRGLLTSTALLEVLACVQPQPNGDFSILSQAFYNHAALLSSVLCILLSWDQQRQDFIQQLQALGIPLRVLIIGETDYSSQLGPMANRPQDFYCLDTKNIESELMRLEVHV